MTREQIAKAARLRIPSQDSAAVWLAIDAACEKLMPQTCGTIVQRDTGVFGPNNKMTVRDVLIPRTDWPAATVLEVVREVRRKLKL